MQCGVMETSTFFFSNFFDSKFEACLKLLLSLQQLFPASTLGYSFLLFISLSIQLLLLSILRDFWLTDVPFLYQGFLEVLWVWSIQETWGKKESRLPS